MILSGHKIEQEHASGKITLEPFSRTHITTNSYDLTLGARFIRYLGEVIDPAQLNAYEEFEVGDEGVFLNKGDFLLAHSVEIVGSEHYVPIIHARSSIARLGLFVHVTADLIDIGSIGNVTFQLHSCLPIRLYPGMNIGQVSFWKPLGEITLYSGKYQSSRGPKASQIHKDFGNEVIAA